MVIIMEIKKESLKKYLENKFGKPIKINELRLLGKGVYGTAYLIDFNSKNKRKRLVLKTMAHGGFGHDYLSDIAQNLILANDTFNKLPKHIKSFDVAGAKKDSLVSIGGMKNYYILLEEAKGISYNADLDRILKNGITELDKKRVVALANYLAQIHKKKIKMPALYVRRARDLVGHGEYIMGVLDGYPENSFLDAQKKVELVKKCVFWWVKLKNYGHRLSVIHGDFHPFNILFKPQTANCKLQTNFILLDRSRGEFGEPADDTTSLANNFIFWGLVKYGKLIGEFKELFDLFFETYLKKTKDYEMRDVIAPYFAFRAIVVANPTFYPDKWFLERGCKNPDEVRRKLFSFANSILDTDKVDLSRINNYIEGQKFIY